MRAARLFRGRTPATPPTGGRFGYIVYDPAGYMSVNLAWLKRPAIAGGKATKPQDALAAMGAYNWYWGSFAVNEARGVVTHQTFGALSPAFAGTNQERRFTFSGNRLTLQPPISANGDQTDADLGTRARPAGPDADAPEADRVLETDLARAPQRERRAAVVESRLDGIHRLHRVGTRDGAHDAAVPPAERGRVADARRDDGDVSELHELFRAVHGQRVRKSTSSTTSPPRSIPAPVGTDFQRFVEFSGKRLTLKPPVTKDSSGESVQTTITWERLSD